MGVDLSEERQKARAYVELLPAAQLSALVNLLETMVDPVAQAIAHAPPDDEPFTEEDRAAVAEALEWRKHHQPIPLETVLEDFALGMSDWDEMGKTT